MLVKCYSASLNGIGAIKITIEVCVSQGIRFFIVGLADHAIRESQQRIESALTNRGFLWPRFRVVINLSPAGIPKEGSHYDLSLAMGILAATRQLESLMLKDYLLIGELSLDGNILPVRGILPMVLMARDEGFKGVLVPRENASEASVVRKIRVVPVRDLHDAVHYLSGKEDLKEVPLKVRVKGRAEDPPYPVDFSEVHGQEAVKRALMIVAAGAHNLLMVGPPGSGKSMMARRLPTIMQTMSLEESLETTMVYSVAGKAIPPGGLIRHRPFREPHHSSSAVSLIGGGAKARPGEISLAHKGVLFLDELPEFKRPVLELLRQPLEERKIHISRAAYKLSYPADFILLAAMNPCPCGYHGHPNKECHCGPGTIKHYLSRISGPLLDRIDLQVDVAPVAFDDMVGGGRALGSTEMKERVWRARAIQAERFSKISRDLSNARMGSQLRKEFCKLDRAGTSLIRLAMEKFGLSARAYDRILKVSLTIADLEESRHIRAAHVGEALNYRNLDRDSWSG